VFGRCKVCAEKDHRIFDLQEQIQNLRSLVYPAGNQGVIPTVQIEANHILDGAQQDIEMTAEEARIDEEANALLTGNY
jgi:hypothetical protein